MLMDTTLTRPLRTATAVPLTAWLAVAAVAIGTFTVVTVENLPMGLLTAIGGGLHVSDGQVGMMVTASGLVAAVTAAVLPVAIRRLDRRLVLVGLIALMVVANVAIALAPSYPLVLAARVVVGVGIGGFWALAAGLAVRLVPEEHVGRATSLIFLGAMAANVAGVPAGTLLGELTSWRLAFATVAGLGVVLVVALLALLPRMPAAEPVRVRTLVEQLQNPAVRVGVLATFLLVSGHYGAFTFVSPILQDVSGIGAEAVGPLLLGFGAAGIAGNLVAGAAARHDVRRAIVGVSLALAAILALVPVLGRTPAGGVVLLVLWGFAFGGLPVSVQTWILQAAPGATEAATGLNTSVFNLAIALGALFGSVIVGVGGPTAAVLLAAGLVALTSLVVWRVRP